MLTFVLVEVAVHPWSHSCVTKINAPDVICCHSLSLVASFGSEETCRFPSFVDFNTVPFGI